MLAVMRYGELWFRLVSRLGTWAIRVTTEPGAITVTYTDDVGARRRVRIEMTPEEWDECVSVRWGEFGSAADHVRATLTSLARGETRLVYDQYDLVLEQDRYDEQSLPSPDADGVIRGHWTARPVDPTARFSPPNGGAGGRPRRPSR